MSTANRLAPACSPTRPPGRRIPVCRGRTCRSRRSSSAPCLYAVAALSFEGFASARVFLNFISGNAFLGIAAVRLTFVILSGGIDLSVGAVIGTRAS